MRVLLVEDDAELSCELAGLLRSENFAVDVADNGEDALHLGDTENYDAAVLDLGLPVIDGITVLHSWRREHRDFPVLTLTARDTWSDKVAGFKAGEWRILAALMLRKEVTVDRSALIEHVYEHNADTDSNSIEVIVGHLRRKIGAEMIVTVRGHGYRLTAGGAR